MKKSHKVARELATKNIRIYPSSLKVLQEISQAEGKTIPRVVHELVHPMSENYPVIKY